MIKYYYYRPSSNGGPHISEHPNSYRRESRCWVSLRRIPSLKEKMAKSASFSISRAQACFTLSRRTITTVASVVVKHK